MAKAAAKRSRARRAAKDEAEAPALAAAGSEVGGVLLIGVALLSILSLATFSPYDPVLSLEPVTNGAGAVGASLAGLLFRGVGTGAFVLVAATAFIGGRLVLGHGLPGILSRFWIGAGLLTVSVATLPPTQMLTQWALA